MASSWLFSGFLHPIIFLPLYLRCIFNKRILTFHADSLHRMKTIRLVKAITLSQVASTRLDFSPQSTLHLHLRVQGHFLFSFYLLWSLCSEFTTGIYGRIEFISTLIPSKCKSLHKSLLGKSSLLLGWTESRRIRKLKNYYDAIVQMQQGYVLNQIWSLSREKERSVTPLKVFILATRKQIHSFFYKDLFKKIIIIKRLIY